MNVQSFYIERLRLRSPEVRIICDMLALHYNNDFYPHDINVCPDIGFHSFVALSRLREVAGFIVIDVAGRNPRIQQFLVGADFRRQRLGHRLLQTAIDDIERYAATMDARSRYQYIYLDVPVTAVAARQVYAQFGFIRGLRGRNIGVPSIRLFRRIT